MPTTTKTETPDERANALAHVVCVDPAFEQYASPLLDALRRRANGNPSDSYPIAGFCKPDSDLDPRGDAGIMRIDSIGPRGIVAQVGAHKTFKDPSFEIEVDVEDETLLARAEASHDIMGRLDSPGEWTGDEWAFAWSTMVVVQWWRYSGGAEDGAIDVEGTAGMLIVAANLRLLPCRAQWASAHKALLDLSAGNPAGNLASEPPLILN